LHTSEAKALFLAKLDQRQNVHMCINWQYPNHITEVGRIRIISYHNAMAVDLYTCIYIIGTFRKQVALGTEAPGFECNCGQDLLSFQILQFSHTVCQHNLKINRDTDSSKSSTRAFTKEEFHHKINRDTASPKIIYTSVHQTGNSSKAKQRH
jgi:hypothetical protein